MQTDVEHLAWYAVEVTCQKEKLVASVLSEKGYECFLPVYPKRTVWSDRIRVTSVPLFSGYVFSRFDAQFRLPILVTPGVRAIVGHGKVPAPVPDHDLEAVRIVLGNGLPIEPCERLQEGDRVLVTKGPLAGIEGSFLRHRSGYRLILSVSLIERSVAVEIDRSCVEPITARAVHKQLRPGQPAVQAQRSAGVR
jgi:transcription antitermination factor NusG